MKAEVAKKYARVTAVGLAQIAMFAALMVVGARISIPFAPVPLTFQTVFAVLAGLLLGAKKGVLAMLAYAFMGLVGLPVFSGGGGIFYVVKPSFGYIIGFAFSALAGGLICGRGKPTARRYFVAAVAAMLVDYIIGIAYFILVWQLTVGKGLGMAIVTYNLLYIPKDLVLCLFAGVLAKKAAAAIRR